VQYHDPHVADWTSVPEAVRVEDAAAAVGEADLAILVQNHREYDLDTIAAAAAAFFDTRGKVSPGQKIHRL
ncbi:nucleotide sugar dehydrogenase, partial [Ornithinimicrobium kibberense]